MGTVTPFPVLNGRVPSQIGFYRAELPRILDLYGRMVARPEFRIEKRPALRTKQGMWALIGESGAVLKRGHELAPVLAPVERRLLKLVAGERGEGPGAAFAPE